MNEQRIGIPMQDDIPQHIYDKRKCKKKKKKKGMNEVYISVEGDEVNALPGTASFYIHPLDDDT